MRARALLSLAFTLSACASHTAPGSTPRSPRAASAEPVEVGSVAAVLEQAEVTARLPIDAQSAFVLVDVETGKRLITRRDAFVSAMSALDRRLRAGKESDVGEAELLAHFAAQVRPFRVEQVERMRAAAEAIAKHVAREKLSLDLGGDVPVVLTSGLEEAGDREGVAYTREGVIYLNEPALAEEPTYLLSHELFHVYSHRHPEARDALYAAIGFHRLSAPVTWPESVEARRVSNPDAPTAEHAIAVRYEGKQVLAAYVALVDRTSDQPDLLDQVSTYYALLGASGETAPKNDVVLANYHLFEGFFEQVGHNTGYLAGPEEILADNFEMLLEHPEKARTPALLDELRKVMAAH